MPVVSACSARDRLVSLVSVHVVVNVVVVVVVGGVGVAIYVSVLRQPATVGEVVVMVVVVVVM